MAMDPVVMLAEELRIAEAALSKATKLYNQHGRGEDGELVSLLLARIRALFGELHETEPTSAPGAGELVGMAARRLPLGHTQYASSLHEIGARLGAGRRSHADLVWLRAMAAALDDGLCGKEGAKAAPLLRLAVKGASRPVIVFRAVQPQEGRLPWQAILPGRPA